MTTNTQFSLVKTLPVHNTLGECILWNALDEKLWWTDIHNAMLYSYHIESDTLQKFALPERLCSFGFIENDSRLICAFETGFAIYDPQSANLQWLYKPEATLRGTRFNDGRVDRQGRFWAGTMVEGEAVDENNQAALGSLYWVSDSEYKSVLRNLHIPNSLCWNKDATTLYFADSPTQQILAYDFNSQTTALTNKRVFASSPEGSAPDGSIIDSEDHLWNAQWGGAKIVRYTPSGEIDCELPLPVSQPTCVCFAGPNLNLLCVTSAREGLNDSHLVKQPAAGNLFIFETPFTGLEENRFRL